MSIESIWTRQRFIGRRGEKGTARHHVFGATTPLFLFGLLLIYELYMGSQVNPSGALAEAMVVGTTITFWRPNAACTAGVRLVDVRVPPKNLPVGTGTKRSGRRLLTVGTDCATGKKYTALAIEREMKGRNMKATFRATGQTGIMIEGWGVSVDRVISDFVAGVIETAVLEHQDQEFLLIEGQGSLYHPYYSGVTLGLLHGCAPQSLVMVYDPTRKNIKHTEHRTPRLKEAIRGRQESSLVLAFYDGSLHGYTLEYWRKLERKVSRKPGAGGMQFILPATGSTITQAICSPNWLKACRTPCGSL